MPLADWLDQQQSELLAAISGATAVMPWDEAAQPAERATDAQQRAGDEFLRKRWEV